MPQPEQPTTALPAVPLRKGFTALPMAEQAAAACILLLAVLLCAPVAIDPARTATGSLKKAMSRPASIPVALKRLHTFYDLATLPHADRIRIAILGAIGALWVGGAYAGACVYQPHATTGKAIQCGGAGTLRARAALAKLRRP